MENATKALLIAAAVLVAIIIISLTLAVVRQGQETIQSADMSQAEMDAYNAKFLSYEGNNVSTADVNALLSTVVVHNQNQRQQGTGRMVVLTGLFSVTNVGESSTIPRATGSNRYTVKCYLDDGLVNRIDVTKNP